MNEKNVNHWINTEKIICDDAVKPCHIYPCCPYGRFIELFPLNYGKYSCEIFGHDCPIYYHIEGIMEWSVMGERMYQIPEVTPISEISKYPKKIAWDKLFSGLKKFIDANINSVDQDKIIKHLKEILNILIENREML